MRQSKLFYFLGLLNRKQRKSFLDFLNSPFFNKKEELTQLFELLEPSLNRKEPEEPHLFERLFPDEDFNQTKFRKIKSALLELMLRFLSVERFQSDPCGEQVLSLGALNDLDESEYFAHYYKEALKKLAQRRQQDAEYFRLLARTEFEHSIYLNRQSRRLPDPSMEKASRAFGDHVLIRKLIMAHAQRTRQKTIKQEKDQTFGLELISEIGSEIEDRPYLVKLYYYLYKTVEDPDGSQPYRKLRELLNTYGNRLNAEDALDLYTGTLNYCTKQLNSGNQTFLNETFELYQEMLKHEVLLQNGKLSQLHLKNIIVVAARMKEYNWAKVLLEGFQHRLLGEDPALAFDYNTGILNFYQHEFEMAEGSFNRVLTDGADIYYGLDARNYLMRIYYETGNTIGMESMVNSFRVFLTRNNKIPEHRLENYHQFLRFFRRMINTPPGANGRLEKLKQDILESRHTGRNWLLEKVGELERA